MLPSRRCQSVFGCFHPTPRLRQRRVDRPFCDAQSGEEALALIVVCSRYDILKSSSEPGRSRRDFVRSAGRLQDAGCWLDPEAAPACDSANDLG